MKLSWLQWLLIFVLDASFKFVFLALIGMLVALGSIAWWWLTPAIVLSIFYFLCLFLGFSLVVSLELVKISLGPATRFWSGLLFANLIFAATFNTAYALSLRKPVFEIALVTQCFVATNLMSVLTIVASKCLLQRFRRLRGSHASAD